MQLLGEQMKLTSVIKRILSSYGNPMTPQRIREVIKREYKEFYVTPSHVRNVQKKHYKDIDHALLAQIYTAVRADKELFCDRESKPMKISFQFNDEMKKHERNILCHQKKGGLHLPGDTLRFDEKISDILSNSEKYHKAYYEAEIFRGPSLYFHLRALETKDTPGSLSHLECVYATLASWGMHRMGTRGSKMQSFDIFLRSVEPLKGRIAKAQTFDLFEMNEDKWAFLKEIFDNLNVMASGTRLVGNSKVMHHMLPNIVPPIDREYTLSYLIGSKVIHNDLDWEWELLKVIVQDFFIPVASNRDFEVIARGWIEQNSRYPWDTSLLKIIDNLVIGSTRQKA